MQSDHLRIALAGSWIVAIGTLGYVSGATTAAAWLALAAVSLVPPALMGRLWSAPAPSMSESIRDVLR